MNDQLERQLMEAKMTNNIIAGFLNDANRGYMDREEALTRIVLALHSQNADLVKRVESLMEKGVPPVILNMSSEDVERLMPLLQKQMPGSIGTVK